MGTRAVPAEIDRNAAPLDPIRPGRPCRHEAPEGRFPFGY